MSALSSDREDARIALVEEHVRSENRHDLEAVMATFGTTARYDDEPWDDHRRGLDGVRSYYVSSFHSALSIRSTLTTGSRASAFTTTVRRCCGSSEFFVSLRAGSVAC
jgi:tellurite resistance protein